MVEESYGLWTGTAGAANRVEPGMGAQLEAINPPITHFPNPLPGVTTTPAFSSRMSKNFQESMSVFTQM